MIFYGTTQSIDPNDPVSTPRTNFDITTPNSSSSTTSLYQIYSAQYPRISPNNFVFSKVGSGGKLPPSKLPNKSVYIAPNLALSNDPLNQMPNNKKLATKQGQSSTFALNSKNTKANKNSKGKSQENTKSNKNMNSGKLSMPKESNQTQSQSAKNKFYRISQQNKMSNSKAKSPSENPKTKNTKVQQSAEKVVSPSHEDKTNRKVIGDLPSPASGKLSSLVHTTANIKPPIKATKQVKDPSSTKLPLTSTTEVALSNRGSVSMESNQRITKLFERYEKIQSIFPEFHPYQPGSKDKGKNITSSTATSVKVTKIIPSDLESRVPSTSGSFTKPSRENTRKLSAAFLPDQSIIKNQQLLLAAAGVSAGTQKPIGAVVASSHRKSSNGTLGTLISIS